MDQYYDFSLREGSSMVVSGPTMCGKSTFVHALLNDKHMFSRPPERVYWFYGQVTDNLKATKRPHGSIFIDLRQETPDDFRIRSRVLPKEYPMRIYKQGPPRHGKHIINKDG